MPQRCRNGSVQHVASQRSAARCRMGKSIKIAHTTKHVATQHSATKRAVPQRFAPRYQNTPSRNAVLQHVLCARLQHNSVLGKGGRHASRWKGRAPGAGLSNDTGHSSQPGCGNSEIQEYPPSGLGETRERGLPLDQNTNLRRRASPGVRRGHPAGRPGPTRRRLSALRGGWLPFVHDFDDRDRDTLKLMSSKVGRCRARFLSWVSNVSS